MEKSKVSGDSVDFEKRRINISSKRQITIPAKYFEALELNKELDCIYSGNMLILTPVKNEDSYFAEEILKDLIDQGYSGDKLISEFTRMNRNIRPAVEKMIEEADRVAEKALTNYKDKTDEIFGDEETED